MSKKAAMISMVKVKNLKPHPDNPRHISEDKFELLKKSLTEFKGMTDVRPLVVNQKGEVIGGNMRMRAMKDLAWTEAPCFVVDWTEERQREFMIKDNASFGSWDYDLLANEWEPVELEDWGLDVWQEPEPEESIDDFGGDEGEDKDGTPSEPKASQDGYSLFELVMEHDNKAKLVSKLNEIKQEYSVVKQEEALMILVENHEKQ